ncbi:MAG: sigma-54 dependent transcriptional regulator [Planctomycetota bacterium]
MTPRPIHILLVDDEQDFRESVAEKIGMEGHRVVSLGEPAPAIEAAREKRFDVAVLDIRMPEMDGVTLMGKLRELQPGLEVIMITGHGTIETAVEAMRKGAYDFLTKPLKVSELLVTLRGAYEKSVLRREAALRKQEAKHLQPHGDIVGRSPALREVLSLVSQVGPAESTVLVEGETGTGKELVAHGVHRASKRADGPFVVLNCAALSETLLESELFGHERGAYTGAMTARPGLFEVADGGTLFLDEIGEMSPGGQAKLLRVLETGRFRRLGDVKELEVDVRVIAATNRNLGEMARTGKFRQDLYHRINVFRIVVPPLRERREDIPLLAEHFLSRHARGEGRKELAPEAMALLVAYDWPGNVRELANLIERAALIARGSLITSDLLPIGRGPAASPSTAAPLTLREAERRHIAEVLSTFRGDKAGVAKHLGITLRHLYRKMKKYRLSASGDDGADSTRA